MCLVFLQPVQTPKRPNDEDSDDNSDEEGTVAKRMRRMARSKADSIIKHDPTRQLPKTEPALTDLERENILQYVENEETQVIMK